MKRILIAFAFIGIAVGCHNPQKQAEKMKAKMADKINAACQLTPDQENKIMPLIDNFVKVREENKDKSGSDENAFKKANEVNRKQFMDTLKTILTPDQFEKLKESFHQQKANEGGGEQ